MWKCIRLTRTCHSTYKLLFLFLVWLLLLLLFLCCRGCQNAWFVFQFAACLLSILHYWYSRSMECVKETYRCMAHVELWNITTMCHLLRPLISLLLKQISIDLLSWWRSSLLNSTVPSLFSSWTVTEWLNSLIPLCSWICQAFLSLWVEQIHGILSHWTLYCSLLAVYSQKLNFQGQT